MKKAIGALSYFGIMISSSIVGFIGLAGINSDIFDYDQAISTGGVAFAFLLLWSIYGVSRFITDARFGWEKCGYCGYREDLHATLFKCPVARDGD
jgi:hypothetical protein